MTADPRRWMVVLLVLAATAPLVLADISDGVWRSNFIANDTQQTLRAVIIERPHEGVVRGETRRFVNAALVVQCRRRALMSGQLQFTKTLELILPFEDATGALLDDYFGKDMALHVSSGRTPRDAATGGDAHDPDPVLAHVLPDISGRKKHVMISIASPVSAQRSEAYRAEADARGENPSDIERALTRQQSRALSAFDDAVDFIGRAPSEIAVHLTEAGSKDTLLSVSFSPDGVAPVIEEYDHFCNSFENTGRNEYLQRIDLDAFRKAL